MMMMMITWMRIWKTLMSDGRVSTIITCRTCLSCRPSHSPVCFLERSRDINIQRDGELSDSEDEGEGGRKHRKDRKKSTPVSPPRGGAMDVDDPPALSTTVKAEGGSTILGGSAISLDVDGPPSAMRDE